MKNLAYIISSDGRIKEAFDYLGNNEGDNEFSRFVEIEIGEVEQKKDKGIPKYLKIARKFGFDWENNAEIGLVSYDYKADLMRRLIMEYSRKLVNGIGFPVFEVSGSNMFDMSHPVVRSYADLYGDRLYKFEIGNKAQVMSYDASYPQFNLAQKGQLSYKKLPFAHFSISDCYRHEQSGECMLLYRQRRFYMPDLHPYFESVKQAFEWIPELHNKIVNGADSLSRKYHQVVEVSSPVAWEENKDYLVEYARISGKDILILVNREDKGLYWIINADYKIIDDLGQSREIACIQVDVGNAKRLGIKFQNKEGEMVNPIIVHSAIPGGIERFLYMAIDQYPEYFPLWLYPIQIRLVPISSKYIPFCMKLVEKYSELPVRFDIDDRSENVSYRIKSAKEDLIPKVVLIGEKEVGGENSQLEEAIDEVVQSVGEKPFIPMSWPICLSKQI